MHRITANRKGTAQRVIFFQIVAQLKKWTDESPIAKWVDITDDTYTVMENPIYMMIIDDPSSGQILSAKQVVLIVAGNLNTSCLITVQV